jgi:hypothetical protein
MHEHGDPHTDEFGSLEPKPSWTREPDSYVYGSPKRKPSKNQLAWKLLVAAPSPRSDMWAKITGENEVKQNQTGKMLTFGMKNRNKIGFWNVRIQRDGGKLRQVIKVTEDYWNQ